MLAIKKQYFLGCIGLFIIFLGCLMISLPSTTTDNHQLLFAPQYTDCFKKLFSYSSAEIQKRTEEYLADASQLIDEIAAFVPNERTFKNSFGMLDHISSTHNLAIWFNCLYLLKEVHLDQHIRNAARDAVIKIEHFFIEKISNNRTLFNALQDYADRQHSEPLSDEQRYFITLTIEQYKRSGINLPDEKRALVMQLKKEIAELSLAFEMNISADQSSIIATHDQLSGVPDSFLNGLNKNEQGCYILKTDYPTVNAVLENCTVSETRKRLSIAFSNRAYPSNEQILKTLMAKRNELAVAVGFNDYSSLDLDDQMIKTPEKAVAFIKDLLVHAQIKANYDVNLLATNIPDGVECLPDGTFYSWDLAYIQNQYKKKTLNIDEHHIANYFPMEHTIAQLLDIYTQFFGIHFIEQSTIDGLWHPDVKVIAARKKDTDELLGYLLLDLYPRPFKYSHACHISLIPGVHLPNGKETVRVSAVLANFTKPTEHSPSLLKRHEVETFFHEFGHAIHALFGVTTLGSFSGTNTKRDFVELPSQMLEEWLYDPIILRKISKHYNTGEQLPDTIINQIVASKSFLSGIAVSRQIMLSLFCLDIFSADDHKKDPYTVWQKRTQECQPYLAPNKNQHGYASFGHLTGYAAKYYGYLWSKVFALDLFSVIKQHGLLNNQIGQRYITTVIGKGGSQDPNILLESFLGRKPSHAAYLHDRGFDQ